MHDRPPRRRVELLAQLSTRPFFPSLSLSPSHPPTPGCRRPVGCCRSWAALLGMHRACAPALATAWFPAARPRRSPNKSTWPWVRLSPQSASCGQQAPWPARPCIGGWPAAPFPCLPWASIAPIPGGGGWGSCTRLPCMVCSLTRSTLTGWAIKRWAGATCSTSPLSLPTSAPSSAHSACCR
jgi:hypothetical protein